MKSPATQNYYLHHGPLSNPGRHGRAVDRFQGSSAYLCETVQGLLMHDAALPLYDLEAADFVRTSRQTLSVETRLDQFCGPQDELELSSRAPAARMIGTCRDYALLLTGFLRQHGAAARVRCGFAAYLTAGTFDDHWICQVWSPDGQRWRTIDAQLDEHHRSAFAIQFDHLDVPDGQFLTADMAWQAVRSGTHDPALFNAGAAACGEWLICVNLARDYLALCKQETSEWDGWRAASEAARQPEEARSAWADRLAEEIAAKADDGDRARDPQLPGAPFW